MTLDQLTVLHTILEAGSFRLAAESLHRAQSAVSYAIKTLEQELGFSIFDRSSYRPTLTPQGKAIYQKTKILLEHVKDLRCLGEQLMMGTEPEVTLVINAMTPLSWITEIFEGMEDKFSVQCQLQIESSVSSMERLQEGEADIVITDVVNWSENLEIMKLTEIELIPVCSPRYEKMPKKERLEHQDLYSLVQIVLNDGSRKQPVKMAGVLDQTIHWGVSNLDTQKEFLLAGLGWGLVPAHLIEKEIENQELYPLPLSTPIISDVNLYLIRRRDRPFGPVNQYLWSSLSNRIS